MPKGLSAVGAEKDKRSAGKQGKYPELRLKQKGQKEEAEEDAKIARIRFLSGWNNVTWGCFHSIPARSRLGKMYKNEVYCVKSGGEEAEISECQYCLDEDREISWAKIRYFFWVWVYEIYHVSPDKDKTWKKKTYMGDTYYIEPVNAVRILKTGTGGLDNALENKFAYWNKRNGSLEDRDYDWCRNGVNLETGYDLVPRDEKTPLSKEQKTTKDSLPDLEDVVIKGITSTPKEKTASEEEDQPEKKTKKKTAKKEEKPSVEDMFEES